MKIQKIKIMILFFLYKLLQNLKLPRGCILKHPEILFVCLIYICTTTTTNTTTTTTTTMNTTTTITTTNYSGDGL